MENMQPPLENLQETPVKEKPFESKNHCKTPTHHDGPTSDQSKNSTTSTNELCKNNSYNTPDPLKVPKALKYTERYKSPTDMMMSPVTKGLLARNRKGGASALLPPSIINQTKKGQEVLDQDVLSCKIDM